MMPVFFPKQGLSYGLYWAFIFYRGTKFDGFSPFLGLLRRDTAYLHKSIEFPANERSTGISRDFKCLFLISDIEWEESDEGGIAMEQLQTSAGVWGDLDRDAFERVWRRVMPEDRLDCPFTLNEPVPPPAVPAAPLPQTPPAPAQTAPQPPCREEQKMSIVCLGQASAVELPRLDTLLQKIVDACRIYRALSRRPGLGALYTFAVEKRQHAKRLAAARFLISGSAMSILPTPAPRSSSAPLALRERFQAEQQLVTDFSAAAQAVQDPCLSELYRTLSTQAEAHARRLWDLVEVL